MEGQALKGQAKEGSTRKGLRTGKLLLAATLLFTPLYLGANGSDSSSCASMDPAYRGNGGGYGGYDGGYDGGGSRDTVLGSWDRCSDGSRVNFMDQGRDILGELDPSQRQYDLGYRDREIVWRGQEVGAGRYEGEFKQFDRSRRARWVPCDIDVRDYEMRMCGYMTCTRR